MLSPKLNHGFSGKNTIFSKISYKYTHHTKYLPLEVYILSTSNFNWIDHFKHKIALKHTFQSNNFSQLSHDNEYIKVALSLMFGLKQFTKHEQNYSRSSYQSNFQSLVFCLKHSTK